MRTVVAPASRKICLDRARRRRRRVRVRRALDLGEQRRLRFGRHLPRRAARRRDVEEGAVEQLARDGAGSARAPGRDHRGLDRRERAEHAARCRRNRNELELQIRRRTRASLRSPRADRRDRRERAYAGDAVARGILEHAGMDRRRVASSASTISWRASARNRSSAGMPDGRRAPRRTSARVPSAKHAVDRREPSAASSRSASSARRRHSSTPCRRSCKTRRSTDRRESEARAVAPPRSTSAADRARPDTNRARGHVRRRRS